MKRSLILVLIGLISTQAHAIGSLNLDMRADMLSQTYNDAALAAPAAGQNNYRFVLQTARLDYKGTLNEATTFRARIRFAAKTQGAMDFRDNTNPTLDFAYVTHKMSDFLKLTVGKLATEIGGYEGNTAGPDLYFTSEAYGGSVLSGTAPKLVGYSGLLYETGAKLTFSFGDNDLSLVAFNLDAANDRGGTNQLTTTATTSANSQDKNAFGVAFKNSLLDKTLGFMASYYTQATTPDNKNDWTTVGVQWSPNPIVLQVDFTNINSAFGASPASFKDVLTSTTALVTYAVTENFAAGVKASTSAETLDSATTPVKNKYMSYGLQAEFKPVASEPYRYHLALNNRTMTPDAGDARNLQEIIVGMRINADFLK